MKFLARISALFPIQRRGTIVVLDIPSNSINSVRIRIGDELEFRRDDTVIGKFPVGGIDMQSPVREPTVPLAILIRHDEDAKTSIEIGLEVWQLSASENPEQCSLKR
jgi:hypothetical protein